MIDRRDAPCLPKVIWYLVAALSLPIGQAFGATKAILPEPFVEDISVQPIDRATGRPLADLVAKGEPVVNGQVDGATVHQYLVTIGIRGQPNLDLSGKVVPQFVRRLSVDVTERGGARRKVVSIIRNVGAIPTSGILRTVMVIEPGACAPLSIDAKIVGGQPPSAKTVGIDFVCQD